MNIFKILVVLVVLLSACSSEMTKRFETTPTAFGKLNSITIIADQDVWEGPIGDSIRMYVSPAYLVLPQPEPMFDLLHFSAEDLLSDPLRKELRNYLIITNVNDPNSATTRLVQKDIGAENLRRAQEDPSYTTMVGLDKWAKGQLLVYLFGQGEKGLIENVKKKAAAIHKRMLKADEKQRTSTIYLSGLDKEIMANVSQKMGVSMEIPGDYFTALSNDKTMWLRWETDEASTNIFLHKMPYKAQEQFSKENLKTIRDSLGRALVSSEIPNTYMRINDVDLPMLTQPTKVGNSYALEARGIWEIVNDYMGGAFVSYLVLNPVKNEVLFMDGFVYAPGKDKREFMQFVEHILNTATFNVTQ